MCQVFVCLVALWVILTMLFIQFVELNDTSVLGIGLTSASLDLHTYEGGQIRWLSVRTV